MKFAGLGEDQKKKMNFSNIFHTTLRTALAVGITAVILVGSPGNADTGAKSAKYYIDISRKVMSLEIRREIYRKSTELIEEGKLEGSDYDFSLIYRCWGNLEFYTRNFDVAILCFKKAIEFDPKEKPYFQDVINYINFIKNKLVIDKNKIDPGDMSSPSVPLLNSSHNLFFHKSLSYSNNQ